jgi:GTP cyclohydrolase II
MANDTERPEASTGLQFSSAANGPTHHGTFKVRAVRDQAGLEHVIVYKGDLTGKDDVPVRIHSECHTSEVLHSLRCDCRQQLDAALEFFESEGIGVMIYLRQEGRGIGLFNKIEAYALQDRGLDTVAANSALGLEADARTYEVAVEILHILGIRSVRLLTNNPRKIEAFRQHDMRVQRIPHRFKPNQHNAAYLLTKQQKMEHFP